MKHKVVVLLLALLVAAPLGQAQWIDDDDGDAREQVSGVDAAHGRAGPAEIHAVDIEETEDAVRFLVQHGGSRSTEVPILDDVFYDLRFQHGDAEYRVRAIYQIYPEGGTGYRAALYEGTDSFAWLQDLEIDGDDASFTVTVPKEAIPDEVGFRPARGTALTAFQIQSSWQSGGTFCMESCITFGPSASDQAPDTEEGAEYPFQMGIEQDGDIRLVSPAPVRWSNGEATVFVYEVLVHNLGDEEDTILFFPRDVPAGWAVAPIDAVTLPAGAESAVPVAVRVPFAHAHGSDPRFLLEALGQGGVGRIELGVHYPAIPQPTGHHAQVYFHSRSEEVFIFEKEIYNAVGGGLGELAYMNTVEDHAGDESVPVKGFKDSIGGDLDVLIDGQVPDYGVVYTWAVPLAPGLRVGLQTDPDSIAGGNVQLGFDVPAGDVRVQGRLAVVPQDEFDRSFNFDTDAGETVATIPPTDLQTVAATVLLPFDVETEAQNIPFMPDQELVLFLSAHVVRPDVPLTPNTGVYLLEGDMVLPLKEYHDAVPVEVALPEAAQEAAVQSLDEAPSAATEAKDTPGVGILPLLAAVGLAAWRRRTV